MHYLTYVFIPCDRPVEAAVCEAMTPFADGLEVKPWKRPLATAEVAVMARRYGLPARDLAALSARMREWTGRPGGVDEQGLFEEVTYNPDGKWDWYEVGGRWDGLLPGNSMPAGSLRRSQLLKKLAPYDFITPDGVWHSKALRVTRGWPPLVIEKSDRRWLAELKAALEAHPAHRVVGVDRHS